MSYTKLYFHICFATKHRRKVLVPELDGEMEQTISRTMTRLHSSLRVFGGAWDHIHLVASLKASLSVETAVREIKRNLSWMLRRSGLRDFGWQDGYWAASCSPFRLGRLYRYVENQRERHEEQSLEAEIFLFENLLSQDPVSR